MVLILLYETIFASFQKRNNMPQAWLLRCLRRACICLSISTAFLILVATCCAVWLFFDGILPARRAAHLELDCLDALVSTWLLHAIYRSDLARRLNRSEIVQRSIKDVPQLHYWTDAITNPYDEYLRLNEDGTGHWLGTEDEFWIYLGGSSGDSIEETECGTGGETMFKHRYRTTSCGDAGYICDMFNGTFDRIGRNGMVCSSSLLILFLFDFIPL
jgi:hypothetical protein